jgi:hypothetical protein
MTPEPSEVALEEPPRRALLNPTRTLGRNLPLVLAPSEASSPRGIVDAEVRARDEKEQGPLPAAPMIPSEALDGP